VKRLPVVFSGSAASPEQFPRDGLPEVAFLGRSNVGKSSLLNALAGVRDLARTSSTPGRTRLINFFRVGNEMYFADLPGYGYARVPHAMRADWERLVTSYLIGREELVLGVFLLDARHEPGDGDQTLRAMLAHHRIPYLIAATKIDKLGPSAAARRCRLLSQGLAGGAQALLPVSATTGAGIDELWRTIRDVARSRREEQVNGR
jgi:GTP-binding protein